MTSLDSTMSISCEARLRVTKYFSQYLVVYRFTGVPSIVEVVYTDDFTEVSSGAFADLCRKQGTRKEFSTADGPQFNGVGECGNAMIESAGKVAAIQVGLVLCRSLRVTHCGLPRPTGHTMLST